MSVIQRVPTVVNARNPGVAAYRSLGRGNKCAHASIGHALYKKV